MKLNVGIFAAVLALSMSASAQDAATVKSGQTVDLGAVYWVENCQSRLQGFKGVDLRADPAGVTLSLRKENVRAARQQCPQPVPGATVVATAPTVTRTVKGTIHYQVSYLLADGSTRTSDHTRAITITP